MYRLIAIALSLATVSPALANLRGRGAIRPLESGIQIVRPQGVVLPRRDKPTTVWTPEFIRYALGKGSATKPLDSVTPPRAERGRVIIDRSTPSNGTGIVGESVNRRVAMRNLDGDTNRARIDLPRSF